MNSLLQRIGATKFLDINLRAPWYDEKIIRRSLKYADIVKLNTGELAELAEMFELPWPSQQRQLVGLMNKFDIFRVIVTCGKEGAWQINRNGRTLKVGAKNRVTSLVDTVGARDGFSAVCILGTLQRWPTMKGLKRANAFAFSVCDIWGAVPENVDFYKPFSRDWGI